MQPTKRRKILERARRFLTIALRLSDEPAETVFVGVRKVIAIMHPFPRPPNSGRPRHGTEITYSILELDSARDVSKLAKGRPVSDVQGIALSLIKTMCGDAA